MYLLDTSKDINAVDIGNTDDRTCLHIAALTNNLPLCKDLLDHNANVNSIMTHKVS